MEAKEEFIKLYDYIENGFCHGFNVNKSKCGCHFSNINPEFELDDDIEDSLYSLNELWNYEYVNEYTELTYFEKMRAFHLIINNEFELYDDINKLWNNYLIEYESLFNLIVLK